MKSDDRHARKAGRYAEHRLGLVMAPRPTDRGGGYAGTQETRCRGHNNDSGVWLLYILRIRGRYRQHGRDHTTSTNRRHRGTFTDQILPMEEFRPRMKEGENADALLARLQYYTLLRLHEVVRARSYETLCLSIAADLGDKVLSKEYTERND